MSSMPLQLHRPGEDIHFIEINSLIFTCDKIVVTLSLTMMLSFDRMGALTKMWMLNPKDRSVVELYGILDPNTRDWTDGLLSSIFRHINKLTDKNEKRYIVFDGDVDALWVENMNSVMDDNRLLTLANGERIRLQKHCALLFEVGYISTHLNISQLPFSDKIGL